MLRADDTYINEILRLEPLLRAFLHRFAAKPHDLDDVVQETYSRLLSLRTEERGTLKSVQAFALTTARNVAVDWMRRRKTIPFDLVEDLDALSVSGDGDSVERMVNVHQELLHLAKAVSNLPERCGEVFTLRKIYGYSQQEIADYFGISISTVEQHLVKAVKRCKAHALGEAACLEPAPRKNRRWRWKGQSR